MISKEELAKGIARTQADMDAAMRDPAFRVELATIKRRYTMKDWNWTEATDEEFERRRKKETYYKIFFMRKTKSKVHKVTVYKFWAKSRIGALAVLKRFQAEHPDETYYYARSGWCSGPDGKRYDDLSEMFARKKDKRENARRKEERARFILERDKIFKGVPGFIKSLHITDKHLRFAVADILYYLRNYDLLSNRSHQTCEKWSIDSFILDTLAFNLPLLIKKNGIPNGYCERARKRLGESRGANGNCSAAAMELAESLWNAELEKLLLYVRLYQFYTGFGIINEKNAAEVAIRDAYAHTLPYIEGTYQELDHRKLGTLCDKYWNLWIDQYRKIGRNLWD